MKLSVIIPYYRGHDYLDVMFKKLLTQLIPTDEVIIVNDNSMNIAKLSFLFKPKKLFGNLRIINIDIEEQGRHIGHRAYARNLGAKESSGEILLFLDEDIILDNGFINRARAICEDVKDVIVHGTVYDYHSRHYADKLNTYYPLYENREYWFDRCPSNNLAMRRETFEKIGKFDNNFTGWGWEDIELGYKAYKVGIKYSYPANLICYHVRHAVSHRDNLLESERNYRYLIRKFPELNGLEYPYSKVTIYNRR